MAGKDPREAFYNFLEPVERVISRITDVQLVFKGGTYPGKVHQVTLGDGDPVTLHGDPGVFFTLRQRYEIIRTEDPDRGPWKVTTRGYWYEFDDSTELEIVGYHWHPTETPDINHPHCHVGAGLVVNGRRLDRVHLPTGRVSLESVVRLAIEEQWAQPLRDDWREILDQAEAAYLRWRTWAGSAAVETD